MSRTGCLHICVESKCPAGTVEWAVGVNPIATSRFSEKNQQGFSAPADAVSRVRSSLEHIGGSVLSCMALGLLVVVFASLGLTFPLLLLSTLLALLLAPSHTLCVLMVFLIMTTDSVSDAHGIFAIIDVQLMKGVPTLTVWLLLLAMVITFLLSFTVEQRSSPIRIRFLLVLCGVLALSASRSHAWPAELFRVDLRSFLFPVLFFYLCMNALSRKNDVYRLLVVICATSVLKAVLLDLYYLAGAGWQYATYKVVTLDSGDLLAFICTLLFLVGMISRFRLHARNFMLAILACVPLVFAVIFSFRRTQWIGLLISLAIQGLLGAGKARQRMLRMLLFGALGILGLILVMESVGGSKQGNRAFIVDRFLSSMDTGQDSNHYHLLESAKTLEDLSHSPVFGLGLGSSHSPLGLYANDTVPANVVHEAFLYVWMKLGMPGLVLFGWAALRYLAILSRGLRRVKGPVERTLVLAVASSLGLWLTMFLTGPIPWYLHETFLMATFAAISVWLCRSAAGDPRPETTP